MENIFEQLLSSYDKLKKRTLLISLEEAKKPLDPNAKAKADQYIAQATSKGNQPPPTNKVPIPELGGKSVWVSVEGKAAGKVVTDALGKFTLPLDPNAQGPYYQNYAQFVGLFGNSQPQEGQPGQEQGVGSPELPMGPNLNPEITKSLMKSFQGTINLVRGNFFLHDAKTPVWMDEGPDGMFSQLAMKFTRANGSLEQKLATSFGLMYDHITEKFIKVPVDEYDKETASKTFNRFINVCSKFKDGTFSEQDAAWVSQHVIADKNGLWFRDPVRLDYGLAFDWNNSYTQSQDKFFSNLVESYNRAYEQWSEEKRTDPVFSIKFQALRAIPLTNRTNDLNDIRGKTAEELQVAIHHLAAGRNDIFRQTVMDLKNKFGARLVEAFNYGQSFQMEKNVGTQQLAGYQELVDNLSTLAKGQTMPSNLEEAIFTSVLQRLFRIEAKGMLIRNPMSIEHVGKNVQKGRKADVVEKYESRDHALKALVESGFGAKEATGIIGSGGTISVGLKTAIKPDDAKMGGGSFEAMFESLKGKESQGFMTKMAKDLGIFSYAPEVKVNEAIDSVQSAMDKLDVSMSKISNPKMDQGVVRRQTLDMLNGLVRKQFGFQDLISLENFNDFDLNNEVEMDRLKNYIKRKVMAKMIRKNFKEGKKEYGAFLGLAMCSNGCSQQNQMTNVRFLSTEESLLINHNESIQQAVRNLMEGTYTLDESSSSTLSILDDRGVPTVRMSLSRAKKNTNVATVSLSLSYLRAIAKKPNHAFAEDMMYKFLKGQQELLEGMLSNYSKKKSSPKLSKSDNS